MGRTDIIRYAGLLLLLLAGARSARSQCAAPRDYDAWINCRVEVITQARINQRANSNQTEAPSISGNSTSLVDQSSASDLIGLALNLAGLTSKSSDTEKTSTSFTVSAYSLYATALSNNPLDPAFYLKHRDWRRVSFALGQEFPDEKEAKNNERATLVGIKVLAWDKRDASHPSNQMLLQTVSDHLRNSTPNFLTIARLVQDYIYEALAPTLALPVPATPASKVRFINTNLDAAQIVATLSLLSERQMSAIDKIIADRIDPEIQLTGATRQALETIRRAPQLSIAFQTKHRKEDGADEYRGQAVFDYGVAHRVNLTLNAGFEYKDNKTIGADTRGGRGAGEVQFQLNPETKLTGRKPWTLNVAGEGNWMTQTKPAFKAQAKIAIPLLSGVDFPVSLTWANRTELIDESDVKARFGFAFDFAKLAKTFR